MEDKDLNPCPFCCGEGFHEDGEYYGCITCQRCGATAPSTIGRECSHSLWNSRPIENAKDEEIRCLREALRAMMDEAFNCDTHEALRVKIESISNAMNRLRNQNEQG